MSQPIKTTQTYRNERTILRRVISDLMEGGWQVRINDGEETSEVLTRPNEGVEYLSWEDTNSGSLGWNLGEFYLVAHHETRSEEMGTDSFVYFIVSNGNEGRDVIADYGLALESIMDPILEYFAD